MASEIRKINWQKLAGIPELEDFFEEDFTGFQQLIETCLVQLDYFPEESLAKIAKLRALEVTNGITQWAFRRESDHALSVEKTRICMTVIMGFIKQMELEFPSVGKVIFSPAEKAYVQGVRNIYLKGFKQQSAEARREFHANSTAQFLRCGPKHLEPAMALVAQDYGEMFSEFFIERGQQYIRAYFAGLE